MKKIIVIIFILFVIGCVKKEIGIKYFQFVDFHNNGINTNIYIWLYTGIESNGHTIKINYIEITDYPTNHWYLLKRFELERVTNI